MIRIRYFSVIILAVPLRIFTPHVIDIPKFEVVEVSSSVYKGSWLRV